MKKQALNISNDKTQKILSLIDKEKNIAAAAEARNSIIKILFENLKHIRTNLEMINQKFENSVDKSEFQITIISDINFKLAAMFITHIRNIDRFSFDDKLAHYAGLAPAEHSSGKSKVHSAKKYGCRNLDHAFYLL